MDGNDFWCLSEINSAVRDPQCISSSSSSSSAATAKQQQEVSDLIFGAINDSDPNTDTVQDSFNKRSASAIVSDAVDYDAAQKRAIEVIS